MERYQLVSAGYLSDSSMFLLGSSDKKTKVEITFKKSSEA